MKRYLKKCLVNHLAGTQGPQVLELGIGDGEILSELPGLLPGVQLSAMDVNQTLIDYCRDRIAPNQASFYCQDLSNPWSEDHRNSFDAVYSLQSFHDFGGLEALRSTYEEIALVLKPGGVLINADFVVPLPQDKQAAPRRFPVEMHLQLLKDCGFEQSRVIHEEGLLGCISASRS